VSPRTTLGHPALTPQAVKLLRLSRGHHVRQAAKLAGVAERTWHRWERGESPPDPLVLRCYAEDYPEVRAASGG